MTYTSDAPIYVDGVRLDTLAWNIEKINRAMASRRAADAEVAGLDGAIASLNDTLEPARFGLEMFVQGTNLDGSASGVSRRARLKSNLDELVHLFGKRHALLEVAEAPPGTAWTRNELAAPRPSVNVGLVGHWSGLAADGSWNSSSAYSNFVPARPGDTFTALVTIRNTGPATRSMFLRVQGTDAAGLFAGTLQSEPLQSPIVVAAGQTVTVRHTARLGSNAAGTRLYILDQAGTTPPANTLFVDFALLTPGAYTGPHFDGLTAADATYQYAWTGTAHQSASTRTPLAMRRAWVKVSDTIDPELNESGAAGKFTVGMTIPAGVWEDAIAQDWTLANPGAAAEVTTLQGATERITDAIILVKGPVTSPRVTDPATGAYVELLGGVLGAADYWRINCATWATRFGNLTLASADTAGNDGQHFTFHGGTPNQASFLPLTPVRDSATGNVRRVRLTLTGGGKTAATALSVRARRKYAL